MHKFYTYVMTMYICSNHWPGYVWTGKRSRSVFAGAAAWHRELSSLST